MGMIKHLHYAPTQCRELARAEKALSAAFAKKERAALAAGLIPEEHPARPAAMELYRAARDAWNEARGAYIRANRVFK